MPNYDQNRPPHKRGKTTTMPDLQNSNFTSSAARKRNLLSPQKDSDRIKSAHVLTSTKQQSAGMRSNSTSGGLGIEKGPEIPTTPPADQLPPRPPGMPLDVWETSLEESIMDIDQLPIVQHSATSPSRLRKRKRPRNQSNTLLEPISMKNQSRGSAINLTKMNQQNPRKLTSFFQNFLQDDKGNFCLNIDLQLHSRDSGTPVTDATVQEVADIIPNLRSLRLSGCSGVTDAGLWSLARHCNSLEAIYLDKCDQITDFGLRELAHTCQLKEIDLSDCPQVNDTMLQTLAAGCWLLEKFVLRRCNRVTDAGIAKVAQRCKELKHLDVSECEHVGEFGDKALTELGRSCKNLRVLDLFGCKHVRDLGVCAVAKGCIKLSTLKLTGCYDVSSGSITQLAKSCPNLKELSLAGCIKTTNQDLARLSKSCSQIHWLDVSGSPQIRSKGILELARSCRQLKHLNLANCPEVGDRASQVLATYATTLTSLSLARCCKITETGIDDLTKSCTRLFTLDMSDCPRIGRRYLQKLINRLEFVEWAHGYFGFQPLPNAAELWQKKNHHLLRVASAVKVQALMRGCLSRGGIWAIKLKHVEKTVLPKIQGRVRGYLSRKRFREYKHQEMLHQRATKIKKCYRKYKERVYIRRKRRLQRIMDNEEEAAIIFQKIYRGYRDRKYVNELKEDKRIADQLQRRYEAMLELAAIKVQQAYRGHRGRADAGVMRALKNRMFLEKKKELEAALLIQRVYRGAQGKRAREMLYQAMLQRRKENEAASRIQALYKGRVDRIISFARKEAMIQSEKEKAATLIQMHWKGMRERHLGALMISLLRLREAEERAARKIQNAIRGYFSRHLVKRLRVAMARKKLEEESALKLQRVYRGFKGREIFAITKEQKAVEQRAKPLFDKVKALETSYDTEKENMETLNKQLQEDMLDEGLLVSELEKVMQINTKYHDSSRITGTSQRFETRFLQIQLADQLQQKRLYIGKKTQHAEKVCDSCKELEKKLRLAKRDLLPLTEGIAQRTKEKRRNEMITRIRESKHAAIKIQKSFRGFRVRESLRPESGYWQQLYNEEFQQKYYYNTFTQETRWNPPVGYSLWSDVGNTEVIASGWIECFDYNVGKPYYFHSASGDYRWEKPSENDANGPEWFGQQDLNSLTARSIKRKMIGTNGWEEHYDPDSGQLYYYNALTGESKWSLSPREICSESGQQSGEESFRSSVGSYDSRRSFAAQRSERWQVRYGYEYDEKDGPLKKVDQERSSWIEVLDEESSQYYYYNVMTEESRWDKPDGFNNAWNDKSKNRSNKEIKGKKWFEENEKNPMKMEQLTSRSEKTRDIIENWVEMTDPESGYSYYYNTITEESKWSLSPREAREKVVDTLGVEYFFSSREAFPDTLQNKMLQVTDLMAGLGCKIRDSNSQMPSETTTSDYEMKGKHIEWLKDAIDMKEWEKAEGIVDQMLVLQERDPNEESRSDDNLSIEEERTSDTDHGDIQQAEQVSKGEVIEEICENSSPEINQKIDTALDDTSSGLNNQEIECNDNSEKSADVPEEEADGTKEDTWIELDDGNGNLYYYNESTGQCQWDLPTLKVGMAQKLTEKYGNDEYTVSTEDMIRQAFIEFDDDGTGYIDVSEMKALSSYLGFDLTDSQCDQIMQSVDNSGDGQISMDEFMQWWTSEAAVHNNNAENINEDNSWEELADENGNIYYYNATTGESQWASNSTAEEEWQELDDGNGNLYYYNSVTGESSWENPTVQ